MTRSQDLPQCVEAERALLGSILLNEDLAGFVFESIRPEDFSSHAHRIIFRTMVSLREKHARVELVGLCEALKVQGEIEKALGHGYVASLTDGVPFGSRLAVEDYCRLVKSKALARAIICEAQNLTTKALEGLHDPDELLNQALESLNKLAVEGVLGQQDGKTFRQAAASLLAKLDQSVRPRIMSGIDNLDNLTGGFLPGELIVYTAETGVGKTLLAQQTRRHACRADLHSLFASAEMDAEHLLARELATEAGVLRFKMRRPEKLDSDDIRALMEATAHECDHCRILDGPISVTRIKAAARHMKNSCGLDLAIIDYDELIEAPGETELDQQRNIVVGAKLLAVDLGVPVILISQLRKLLKGEDRRQPTLQRLYGSGAKPKHASIVIFVDREFVRELRGDETKARICVMKNRDGLIGAFDAKFNVRTLRFENAEVAQT